MTWGAGYEQTRHAKSQLELFGLTQKAMPKWPSWAGSKQYAKIATPLPSSMGGQSRGLDFLHPTVPAGTYSIAKCRGVDAG